MTPVAGIACGPINNYRDVLDDPQVQHRGLQRSILGEGGVDYPMVGSPLRLSASPVEYHMPPRLGQHTQEVLRNLLGWSDDRIAALQTAQSASH